MDIRRYPPLRPDCTCLLHGGDYNPDQWTEATWADDMRLMDLAHANAMTVGVFSWAQLEPREGHTTFDWLDRIMDLLAARGRFAVLATPSAAQPAWMSRAYPEILRVHADRRAPRHGFRVNYCLTSPVYRARCAAMAETLARRYAHHPALLLWHVSNEYHGYCYCDLCQSAFRQWLQRKYGTLDRLNQAWWTAFWGHTFSDWDDIEAPGWWTGERAWGEISIQGLTLDWRRFMTDQTTDFMLNEIRPLRAITPNVPVTTNMMGTYVDLDCWRMAPHLDVACWDSYPFYHDRPDQVAQAVSTAFQHDLTRSLKGGRPFLLMESTPSTANWWPVARLKRPGVHRMASLQAVAHGSDSVQYFQWRAGRGGAEKFHGAVVEAVGHDNTQAFRDVAGVGEWLQRLEPVRGAVTRAETAVVYDWEARWAIDGNNSPRQQKRDYEPTCKQHYQPFWQRGIPVDVIDSTGGLARYRLVVAPMLYVLRPGVAERLAAFVRDGGTLVTTYWSGVADENDLLFEGGRPGPLREVLGLWCEAIDALYDDESNTVVPSPGAPSGWAASYRAETFCDLVHPTTARTVAVYGRDYYAGRPAVTVNRFGKGQAWYLAARTEPQFLDDFLGTLARDLGLRRVLDADLPQGVTAQERTDERDDFVFLLNVTSTGHRVPLREPPLTDMLSGLAVSGEVQLEPYGVRVLRRQRA